MVRDYDLVKYQKLKVRFNVPDYDDIWEMHPIAWPRTLYILGLIESAAIIIVVLAWYFGPMVGAWKGIQSNYQNFVTRFPL
jgi:hypothetical protein